MIRKSLGRIGYWPACLRQSPEWILGGGPWGGEVGWGGGKESR